MHVIVVITSQNDSDTIDLHKKSRKQLLTDLLKKLAMWNVRETKENDFPKKKAIAIVKHLIEREPDQPTTTTETTSSTSSATGIDFYSSIWNNEEIKNLFGKLAEEEQKHAVKPARWNGCILSNRKGKTYIKLSYAAERMKKLCEDLHIKDPNRSISPYLHQVIFLGNGGALYDKGKFDISHICDQPKCMTSGHLVAELKSSNGNRKSCKAMVADCSSCKKRYFLSIDCSHQPRCRKYVFEQTTDKKHIISDDQGQFCWICPKGHSVSFNKNYTKIVVDHEIERQK